MKQKTKILVFSFCSCLLVAFLIGIGVPVYNKVRRFSVEDSIHGTFYPLATALYKYQDEHERPAEALLTLVPTYLSAIPSSALADATTYRILPDGKSWELAIHSRALSKPRTYVCRSTQHFSPEERSRIILEYHATWMVFPADR